MEAVLTGPKAAAAAAAKGGAFPARRLGFGESVRVGSGIWRVGFDAAMRRNRAIRVGAGGFRAALVKETNESPRKTNSALTGPVELFVGLPMDVASAHGGVNHAKAIAAGLRALKLLGAYGVELPIFWAAAQPDSDPAQFDWASHAALVEMARAAGLRIRATLCLHGSHRRPGVPLPEWVARAAAADPDILFTDRYGRHHEEYLSFAVDELPVLGGRRPVEAFEDFFRSFRSAFADFFGSTITGITVSLGPNGELRYPSFPPATGGHQFTGVGEFQCYDKYMLAQLKQHAEQSGQPLWGLSGPHDAPGYNQSPDSANFFRDHGGSWETPYADFFLSWYSQQLVNHGDRILSIASNIFGELPVEISGKVPLLHWWRGTRSHPAELTAGFYNTDGRNGYDAVAKMFARNSCAMVIPGMDLLDREQPRELRCSPESLLSEIVGSCGKHGVKVLGENSSLVRAPAGGFDQIKANISAGNSKVKSFTYNRMGAEFFSPEHWPQFTAFMRSMVHEEMDSDDLPSNEKGMLSPSAGSASQKEREMQAV
ncbi:inactive beta-amylase 9-like isoform X2 [Ananas comosus]|uniref:Beta-amylase n=1 Tax=Ananas comosus TaxID=4615 RepID=A0A6P5GJF4_ANACO|nr:inactive beta-amylase 9-like isoform X2 [Ananas comosus]